ncbi:hypothetical protein [Staphylococcus phage vB_StaM_SA1]|nr:hypothetical protein [Staphylococcus phage vB_StaM_SA1]
MISLGNKPINLLYKGNDIIYPNPVKDNLLLWYELKGINNNDTNKDTLKDLSGNDSDSNLFGFNYTNDSGYTGEGLKFDGVDDYIKSKNPIRRKNKDLTLELVFDIYDSKINWQYLLFLANGSDRVSLIFHYGQLDLHINNSTGLFHEYYSFPESNIGLQHVIVTLSGGEILERNIFINGNNMSKSSVNSDTTGKNISLMGLDLEIIRAVNDKNNTLFKTVRIYDRILTEEEINHNFDLEKERWKL